LKEQLVVLENYFKIVYCDSEIGGCDTPFTVEIKRSFSQDTGKNVLEYSATVRKIEGIVPESEQTIAPGSWVKYVIVQNTDGEHSTKPKMMLETDYTECQTMVRDSTGDKWKATIIKNISVWVSDE